MPSSAFLNVFDCDFPGSSDGDRSNPGPFRRTKTICVYYSDSIFSCRNQQAAYGPNNLEKNVMYLYSSKKWSGTGSCGLGRDGGVVRPSLARTTGTKKLANCVFFKILSSYI